MCDFLTRIAQPHELLEAGSREAEELLRSLGATGVETPALIDGTEVLGAVTVAKLADTWQLSAPPSRAHYDLAIVGAGPAGLVAAVYASSDGLSTARGAGDRLIATSSSTQLSNPATPPRPRGSSFKPLGRPPPATPAQSGSWLACDG